MYSSLMIELFSDNRKVAGKLTINFSCSTKKYTSIPSQNCVHVIMIIHFIEQCVTFI